MMRKIQPFFYFNAIAGFCRWLAEPFCWRAAGEWRETKYRTCDNILRKQMVRLQRNLLSGEMRWKTVGVTYEVKEPVFIEGWPDATERERELLRQLRHVRKENDRLRKSHSDTIHYSSTANTITFQTTEEAMERAQPVARPQPQAPPQQGIGLGAMYGENFQQATQRAQVDALRAAFGRGLGL